MNPALLLAASLLNSTAPSPPDIYFRALAAMRATSEPDFISYTDTEIVRHGAKERRIISIVAERTRDRRGRFNGTHPDGSPTDDVRVETIFLPPDVLLHGPMREDVSTFQIGADAAPKTIATLHSVNYRIQLVGEEPIGWSAAAYHLLLTPLGDPLRYNIRELWVDRASYRICRAIVERRIAVGTTVNARMTIAVRPDGYASEYSTTATGHMMGMQYTVTLDELLTDPVPLTDVPREIRT